MGSQADRERIRRIRERGSDGEWEALVVVEHRSEFEPAAKRLDIGPKRREFGVIAVLEARHTRLADPERSGQFLLGDVAGLCCVGGSGGEDETRRMRRSRSRPPVDLGAFAGFRFPPEVILLAVRWYLRFGLSYRDLDELLAERGIEVDHVTLFRWVQRFTPLLVDAARPCRHAVGARWFVDETYVKVAGAWRYVYRAVDEDGQVIDVYVSARRDLVAARRFFGRAITAHGHPDEVITDLAQALETVIEEQLPTAFHNTSQYANNRVECDHGRLKARLRPMPGLKTDRTAHVIIGGHAFIQNLRSGFYELGVEAEPRLRIASAFGELTEAI